MRYAFRLDGRTHHVTLEEHADGPRYLVDGEPYAPIVKAVGSHTYEVTVGDATHTFTIEHGKVREGPRVLDLEVRRARPVLTRSGAGGRRGDGRIKPPMPGKVVEVKVAEGDVVDEGTTLLVLEAMKMQNDVKSPIAGTVSKVHVKEGTNVEANTILLEVAPDA